MNADMVWWKHGEWAAGKPSVMVDIRSSAAWKHFHPDRNRQNYGCGRWLMPQPEAMRQIRRFVRANENAVVIERESAK